MLVVAFLYASREYVEVVVTDAVSCIRVPSEAFLSFAYAVSVV